MTVPTLSVATRIAQNRDDGRGSLIGYLPVGFPDLGTSIDAAVAMVENGVDALELGLPYSDPVMDGLAIQKATEAALAGGFRVRDVFTAVEAVRARVDVPVLVMTYWNPVLQYGVDRFADALKNAGGAGLITPDITPDAGADWIATSERTGLDRVFLAAPSSTDARLEDDRRGQPRLRVRGVDDGHHGGARERRRGGPHARRPACARPEPRTPASASASRTRDQVAEVLGYADGAIVGAALVTALADGGVAGVAAKAAELASGTTATRK